MIYSIDKKKISTAAVVLAAVAGMSYFYLFDPADTKNLYLSCTFKSVTG